ncbi:MAG: DUF2459 domain-containing protein [Candidatus Rokuibacteriota bacterium]
MARVTGLLAALALAAACLTPMADRGSPAGAAPAVPVWVVDHGWHTAIVIRRSDVDSTIWPEVNDFPGAAAIEVAWGDREFYMAADPTAWLAVKAAFFTSGSVLHVAGLTDPIVTGPAASGGVELEISRRGFDAMTTLFHDEYQRDGADRAVRLARGLYGASWFYAGRSRYHVFNTCNTWVARALQRAGLDVTPAGTLTAGGVMRQARAASASR